MQAVRVADLNECPNVWLFLIGLEPTKLSSHVAPYIPLDVVHRPKREDIEEFVRWFARAAGRSDDPVALKPTIDATGCAAAARSKPRRLEAVPRQAERDQ